MSSNNEALDFAVNFMFAYSLMMMAISVVFAYIVRNEVRKILVKCDAIAQSCEVKTKEVTNAVD